MKRIQKTGLVLLMFALALIVGAIVATGIVFVIVGFLMMLHSVSPSLTPYVLYGSLIGFVLWAAYGIAGDLT